MYDIKIIGIHGVPRSGTSWLGQIFNSSSKVAFRFHPFFSCTYKDRLSEKSSRNEINTFFKDILLSDDNYVLQRGNLKVSESYPVFKKSIKFTHLVYKEVRYHHILENLLERKKDIKIIGIIRHPCSVINSWLRAPLEFKKDWNPFEEWYFASKNNKNRKEEFNGFFKWNEVAYMFLKLKKIFPDRFYILKYKDLLEYTVAEVKKLFRFAQLDVEEQSIRFIKSSTTTENDDPYGIYRKNQRDDKWKIELDQHISIPIIQEIKNTNLEAFLS